MNIISKVFKGKSSPKNGSCNPQSTELSWTKDYENLQTNYANLEDENKKLKEEIRKLKRELDKLKRDYDELEKLQGCRERIGHEESTTDSKSKEAESTKSVQTENESNAPSRKVEALYATTPRSGGGILYFAGLNDSQSEDSYFELKITSKDDVAEFWPLDFMKIRNLDSAMKAIQHTGANPREASGATLEKTGRARRDGERWIIETPARIKLKK